VRAAYFESAGRIGIQAFSIVISGLRSQLALLQGIQEHDREIRILLRLLRNGSSVQFDENILLKHTVTD
jgi:hypothetical protein